MPVEVGHHGQVAGRADLAAQPRQDTGDVGGGAEDRKVPVHLDGALDQGGGALGQRPVAGLVQDLRGVRLRLGNVGLVERVDTEDLPGHGRGVLPQQELRPERAADRGRVQARPAGPEHDPERDRARIREHGGVDALHDHRQDPGAVLPGRLRDQLLGPVAEADDAGARVGQHQLVAAGRGRIAHGPAELDAGVVVVEQVG